MLSAIPERPVHSLYLGQGALSHRSYVEIGRGLHELEGRFHRIVRPNKVTGPILTTRSQHDKALSYWYVIATRPEREDFSIIELPPPRYGAVGVYGLQGLRKAKDISMIPGNQKYEFMPGEIYNLDASEIVCNNVDFWSAAHSDILHKELAEVFWAAVMTGRKEFIGTVAGSVRQGEPKTAVRSSSSDVTKGPTDKGSRD
ncbi:uncharacterized protein A1O5_06278 [Cladophialophora psammophila CBS 110553]|uniref:Uncharacterized protein n=1 Tax=Cladophialophora psammophila CBS 110553 TaxID=1182543 RepID=W9WYQ3_9EURO|nr:uncharacterized protein A1O5_06278 [Cladophialophora psammophila CBS 110553]EXJ70210.1 hypothetical protein A1O5_06278 [Cladophialophora psammophila CBS 110553]